MRKIALLACMIAGCTTYRDMKVNQVPTGHFQLYTYPESLSTYRVETYDSDRFKEIYFTTHSNLNGEFSPQTYSLNDPSHKETHFVPKGGVAAIKSYFETLERTFGKDKLLKVNLGSNFHSKASDAETAFYLNYLDYDIYSPGIGEFQTIKPGQAIYRLGKRASLLNAPTILSNLYTLKDFKPYQVNSVDQTIVLERNGVRIGFISAISPQVTEDINKASLTGLYFEPILNNIMVQSKALRSQGAQIIVLLAQAKLDCSETLSKQLGLPREKVNFEPGVSHFCQSPKDEFFNSLEKLPKNMVDLILTSGVDSKVANYIQKFPVSQIFSSGDYLGLVRLLYDNKLERVVLSETKLFQPISLCHITFKETQDCYTGENLRNVELTKPSLFGSAVKINPLPIRK